jgi:hypothetical protein
MAMRTGSHDQGHADMHFKLLLGRHKVTKKPAYLAHRSSGVRLSWPSCGAAAFAAEPAVLLPAYSGTCCDWIGLQEHGQHKHCITIRKRLKRGDACMDI